MQVQTVFDKFCKYVEDTIFSMEYKGAVVAFVIDQAYINKFCDEYDLTEKKLLSDVRRRINSYNASDIRHVKGLLAIQLYAVSKMADGDGFSAKNYRDRLAELLNIETSDLAVWLRENQDAFWKSLYRWCENNDFEIAKSYPNTGLPYGYVQYPIQQAERVLKEQDLKSIACYFVDENLTPKDDLTYRQFWSIINWHKISNYCTVRGRKIVNNFMYETDVKKQIFNYFLRWTGEYVRFRQQQKVQDAELQLYLKQDLQKLEIRDENLELVNSFNLDNLILSTFKEQYRICRNGVILFKEDDIYDDVWIETRYLEKGTEGIAVVFNMSSYRFDFHEVNLLRRFSNLSIYKISETCDMNSFYEDKRDYWFEGGLKLQRNTYLKGSDVVFNYRENCKFWIDGEIPKHTNNKVHLNYLSVGKHVIKVKNYKAIEINIVDPQISPDWLQKHNSWQFNRTTGLWGSSSGEGVVGLDFSLYSESELKMKEINTLYNWSITFCYTETNSKNKAIVALKHILK